MIHLLLPFALASILAGAGVYGILARRNAVLMLIGVELVLAAANLVLVTSSAVLPDRTSAGQVLAIFVVTLAAAEVTLALGIILYAFRQRGHIDLGEALDTTAPPVPGSAAPSAPAGASAASTTELTTSDDAHATPPEVTP